MTARSTLELVTAIGGTANLAKLASDQASEATYNASYAAALATYNAGGSFATFDSTVKTAQRTLVASKQLNAMTHQNTIRSAIDTLRATGDLAPA